jgi:hypothetical protein
MPISFQWHRPAIQGFQSDSILSDPHPTPPRPSDSLLMARAAARTYRLHVPPCCPCRGLPSQEAGRAGPAVATPFPPSRSAPLAPRAAGQASARESQNMQLNNNTPAWGRCFTTSCGDRALSKEHGGAHHEEVIDGLLQLCVGHLLLPVLLRLELPEVLEARGSASDPIPRKSTTRPRSL